MPNLSLRPFRVGVATHMTLGGQRLLLFLSTVPLEIAYLLLKTAAAVLDPGSESFLQESLLLGIKVYWARGVDLELFGEVV
jgi:hypothetical protein